MSGQSLSVPQCLDSLYPCPNVWTVVIRASYRHGKVALTLTCAWAGYSPLFPACMYEVPHVSDSTILPVCKLEATDHVASMVPETPPACNLPSLLSSESFFTIIVIHDFSDLCLYAGRHFYDLW